MDLVIPFGAVSPEHVLTVLVEETENYTVVIRHEEALYEGNMPGVFYQLVAGRTSASSQLWEAPLHLWPAVRGSDADCPPEGRCLRAGGRLQGTC